jgi:hypothetical protein
MTAIAICGGNTIAIIGTVSNGVPIPSAPLIKPPKAMAKKHQAMTQNSYSANNQKSSEINAESYQLAGIREDQLLANHLPAVFELKFAACTLAAHETPEILSWQNQQPVRHRMQPGKK